MEPPKISIIMPVYNSETYLREAVESILNQNFGDFEFIIIDDCSTDSSPEIIQEYAHKDERIVSLYNNQNLKVTKTLNKGINIAKGKYITRMDSDDISLLDRLKKQFEFMEKHPDVVISGGTMELINENGRIIGIRKYHLTDQEIRKHIFRYSPFSHPLIILIRDILDKAGGYNPNLVVAQDYDLYFRLGRFGKFANLQDVLLQYRIHPDSATNKRTLQMERYTLLIRKKAVEKYGYKMNLADKILFLCQKIAIYITPYKFRVFIFNLIRNR